LAAVTAEQIRIRAYLRWEAADKPPGDGVRFWLEAERELCGNNARDDASTTTEASHPTDLGRRFPHVDMDKQC
jgi:hypothetical protein